MSTARVPSFAALDGHGRGYGSARREGEGQERTLGLTSEQNPKSTNPPTSGPPDVYARRPGVILTRLFPSPTTPATAQQVLLPLAQNKPRMRPALRALVKAISHRAHCVTPNQALSLPSFLHSVYSR